MRMLEIRDDERETAARQSASPVQNETDARSVHSFAERSSDQWSSVESSAPPERPRDQRPRDHRTLDAVRTAALQTQRARFVQIARQTAQ